MPKLAFRPAAAKDLKPCLSILMDSILGEEYFTEDTAREVLGEGITKKQVHVAVQDDEIVGFFRLALDGVFLVFAYINLLAVKSGLRGQGIGGKLLKEAERLIRADPGYPFIKKSFLLCGKINRKAKKFYEQHGYKNVSTLNDLFDKGDTEFLMMKEL
jgi:ribosomal protein S18 acetylase RimI-like enzyme